ncbi:peptidoglycan recognition protein family protein, partial [Clostridium neonatale]
MNIIDTNLKFISSKLGYGNVPNKIILHHAEASKCTVEDIHSWHLNNGWAGIGYHYFIRKDGSVYKGRPDGAIGSHCQGSNTGSLGICFEGNYMKETIPTAQYNAGIDLIKYLRGKYGNLTIYGHKELLATECPGSKFPLADFKNLKENEEKATG